MNAISSSFNSVNHWQRPLALLSLLSILVNLLALPALSEPLPEHLDLASTQANLQAPVSGEISIDGGGTKQIDRGALITPAEYTALVQNHVGDQELLVNSFGAATGGTVSLSDLQTALSALNIPSNVTASVVAQEAKTVNVAGSTVINGSLLFTAPTASLFTSDLIVGSAGRIENLLATANSSLNITSQQSVTSSGLIAAAGNVNITAGHSVVNTGVIQSAQANVTLVGSGNSFVVANSGGSISALSGSINISSLISQAQLAVSGGALQAQNVNLTASQGFVSLAAQSVQASLSVKARELSVSVASGDLNVSQLDLSGDPIFNVAGNLTSVGGSFAGQLFQATAGGNLSITGPISTFNPAGRGGNIVLVSGGLLNVTGDISSGGLTEGGDVALVGRNGVTASNISTSAVASGSAGALYVSADGDISIGAVLASPAAGGSAGEVLLTTAGGASGGAITHGTIDPNIQSFQEFTPLSLPPVLLDPNFTNAGDLTVVPESLPAGGFTSFQNTGTITLDRSAGPDSTGFDTMVVPFFVSDPGGAVFNDIFGAPGPPETKGQEFVAVSVGDIDSSRIANSAAGAPLPGEPYVAGEITLVSISGDANLHPRPSLSELSETTDYNTGSGTILLVNGGVDKASRIGRLQGFPFPGRRTGSLTLGGGLIVSRGGGVLNVTADSVDLSQAMSGRLSIDGDAEVGIVNTIAIGLVLHGDLPLVIRGNATGLVFPLGSAVGFGALASVMDITGTTPSITVTGGGLVTQTSLFSLSAGASLTISAESSIILLSENYSVPGDSSVKFNITAPDVFGTQILCVGSDLTLSNIAVEGSGLTLASSRKLVLSGNISSESASLISNGIFLASGDPTGGSISDASQIGITVTPGTNISAFGGNLSLNVYGADTNPLVLPAEPLISIDSATLQSIGYFAGQEPVGGVVGIIINGPPPDLVLDFIPVPISALSQLNQQVVQRQGQAPPLTIQPFASISLEDQQLTTVASGFAMPFGNGSLVSYGNGLATALERNVAGSIDLTGSTISANGGGLLIDPGGTYPGEIVVTGTTIVGSLPFLLAPAVLEDDGIPTGLPGRNLNVQFALPSDPQKNALVPTDLTPVNKGVMQSLTDVCQQSVMFSTNHDIGASTGNGEEWLIAAGICQPFVFQHGDGLYLIGSAGATVGRAGGRTLEIEGGKLIVLATKENGCAFNSRFGKVEISGSSASIVECRTESGKSVLIVGSIAGAPVKFVGADREGNSKQIEITPGQRLIISAAETAADLTDAKTSSKNDRSARLEPCQSAIDAFDPSGELDNTGSSMCRFDCVGLMGSNGARSLKAFIQRRWGLPQNNIGMRSNEVSINNADTRLLWAGEGSYSSDNLLLVSFNESLASNAKQNETRLRTVITDKAETRYIEDATLSFNEQQHMTLYDGEVLLSAYQDVSIKSSSYTISVSEGAMVHVCQQGEVTKVRNVYEHKQKSVKVSLGGSSFALSAGEEALLANKKQYNISSLSDQLGRRDIRRLDLPNGHCIASSEISIVGLIHNSKLLKEVVNSKQKRDRSLANKLISMAACLQMVTMSHGPYLAIQK